LAQTAANDSPISAAQVRVVALCALVTLIEGIDLTLIPALGPKIIQALNVSGGTFGIIQSTGPIGLIAGGVGVGYLADRIGRRNALIVAMGLMTLATLGTTFASSVTDLLVWRLITGVSFGGVIPVAVALVTESLPPRARASVVAFVFLGQSGGGLLAAVIVKLAPVGSPWQTSVYYVTAGCAIVTVLLLTLLPESPRYLLVRGGRRNRLRDLFREGRAPGTALLWLTFIGVCAPVSFFTTMLTTMIAQAGKPGDVGVSAIGWYSAGAMVGGLVLPLFARRWHVNKVLLGSIVMAAVSCAAMGAVLPLTNNTNLVMATVCGVFISGAFFMLYPPAARFYPTHIRSTGIGSAVAFGRIGNTVAPLTAGFMLRSGTDPSAVFYTMAAPMILSCIALVAFDRLMAATSSSAEADAAEEA
jgi:MFS transporter, AAHS family, 4-hydroxybenzoate transporter